MQWKGDKQPNFASPQLKPVNLSRDWQAHTVDMAFPGRIKEVRFVLRDAGWQANLRNVRLLTPDGSVITSYEFY